MKSFIIAAAVLGLSIPVFAGTLNLSTGYNGGGTLICATSQTGCGGVTSVGWSVVENNTGGGSLNNNGATGPGLVVDPNEADWFGGWVANGTASPASDWIAYAPNNGTGNGLGTYSTTFTLTAGDVAAVVLSGSWALDDTGFLYLNGHQIGTLTAGYTAMTAFSVAAGNSDFQIGTNTLTAQITSTDVFLEGVNVSASLSNYTAPAGVPEPSTLLLVPAGLGLAVFLRRRRHAH